MSPEPVKKVGLIPHLGSRFRYSGRTHYETKKTPIDRQPPQFERSLSGRRLTSRSMDGKSDFCHLWIMFRTMNASRNNDDLVERFKLLQLYITSYIYAGVCLIKKFSLEHKLAHKREFFLLE